MFRGKTVFVSGGSRGIGLEVALRLAREGANITIAAKTATPHPKLPGTIYTAAEEIEKAGGKALPLVVDIRNEEQVESAINKTVEKFGGLDIVINNASAISLTSTESTPSKVYDLMHNINSRGTWLVSKLAIPHLLRSASANRNPHILTFSPLIHNNITVENFAGRTAYAMAKYGMSLATLGLSGELEGEVGVNALWPLTMIDTEATRVIPGAMENRSKARHASIMAEAAFAMLSKPGAKYNGNFEIDEIFLRKELGWKTAEFRKFASVDDDELVPDLFIPPWVDEEVSKLRAEENTAKSKL